MDDRHNALLAVAKLVEAVQDVVTREPGRQVGTVGRLAVYPNAPNVVPGLVKHSIELRDLSPEKIDGVLDRKSTRLNSSHLGISYAVFCLKKKNKSATSSHSPPHVY